MRNESIQPWLTRAADWRFASLLFQPPAAQRLSELRGLAEEVTPARRDMARRIVALASGEAGGEFHEVLGPSGTPPTESAYDPSTMATRGPLLAGVAAFYEAFAYRPDGELHETPDHAAVELGFLAYLSVKAAFALHEQQTEAFDVSARAFARFLDEHPRHWMPQFLDRLAVSDSALYAAAGEWVAGCLGN
jgi:hypothetical protein